MTFKHLQYHDIHSINYEVGMLMYDNYTVIVVGHDCLWTCHMILPCGKEPLVLFTFIVVILYCSPTLHVYIKEF